MVRSAALLAACVLLAAAAGCASTAGRPSPDASSPPPLRGAESPSTGASAPRASGPLYSVVLRAPQPYVLCVGDATSRKDCIDRSPRPARDAIAAIRAAAMKPGVQRVILLVPGYRTKFADGRRDAGNVARVLGSRFLIVHIDWGSHGPAADYELDGAAARKNAPEFAAFLTDLHAALPGRELGVFAHSMGSRVAAGAMAIVKAQARGPIVRNAVLAAPDLTLADYKRAITRDPEPFGRVFVYVSTHDKALLLSDVVHLHRRLGQLEVWRHAVANTDVIDASAAAPGKVGHSYAFNDPEVVEDIGAVFLDAPLPHPGWARAKGEPFLWALVPARVPALASVTAPRGG